ncbi:hypothetical protein [Crocinitomix catalasitica]|uniref:hypothetical protein n=1 Tax=Crocinitomix catalasitica TaxID=184607 RepID=UPI0004866106|nr:hypothetical protein [Crocinitomix catalasitica]
MKLLFFFLITSLVFSLSNCSEDKSWIYFDYDVVKAFHYTNEGKGVSSNSGVFFDGKMNPTVINPIGAKLNPEQIKFLGEVLNGNKNTNETGQSECYIPHHGIVFYKSDDIVAHISICFMCDRIESVPKNRLNQTVVLEPMFRELGIPINKDVY